MTFVMGIHLGHDTSVSIVDENGLVVSVVQERLSRIRHDYGLESITIEKALAAAEIKWEQLDSVALTCTQMMPAIVRSSDDFYFEEVRSEQIPENKVSYQGRDWVTGEKVNQLILGEYRRQTGSSEVMETVDLLTRTRKIPIETLDDLTSYQINDPLIGTADDQNPVGLIEVISRVKNYLKTNKSDSFIGQSKRVEVTYKGISKSGRFWAHHASHAASNLAIDSSPRPIITHDGGLGIQSGCIWHWTGENLQLVTPHFLELGAIYDYFANNLGLGYIGGAGKLMGLASYGSKRNKNIKVLPSNYVDLNIRFGVGPNHTNGLPNFKPMWDLAIQELKLAPNELTRLGNAKLVTETGPTSIAFWIQNFVQETYTKLATEVFNAFSEKSLGLSGGFALNCPTNSNIFKATKKSNVIVEPHCEDGGCSIGAAILSIFELTGAIPTPKVLNSNYAYASAEQYDDEDEDLLKLFSTFPQLEFSKPENVAKAISQLIIDDRIVAIFSGKSEIGPRALGHRSVICNPEKYSNWARVNRIKTREEWRPFAPVVLEKDCSKFFENGPASSPFMLFNYSVKERWKSKLQAITHVDGTSRVQTITDHSQPLFAILTELKNKRHIPVVMNTSFNGPGEPIIETPKEAIQLFLNSELDALSVGKYLITKK